MLPADLNLYAAVSLRNLPRDRASRQLSCFVLTRGITECVSLVFELNQDIVWFNQEILSCPSDRQ